MPIKHFFRLLLLLCVMPAAHAALTVQHWQTSQGARVYFVESRDLPMLDLAVEFPAGSGRDPAEKPGVAHLTQGLLDQGAGGMSDTEIAHRLADSGAILGGRFDRDRAGVTLRTLSSLPEREIALDVLIRVLQQPAFDPDVLNREKRRLVAALGEDEANPGKVAGKAFYRALYGDHPYGHDEKGSIASIVQIDRADLEAFHRRHYSAPNAVIALMGDIDRDQAEVIAESIARGLPAGEALLPLSAPGAAKPQEQRITHPSTQSHVLVGAVGMARDDPEFFPLFVGNYVLGGGGFDSRLMREVRDKRGYAYSAYSYFSPMSHAGPFVLGLQTKIEQTDDALKVASDTLREFISEGPSEAELKQARDNLTGGFPLRIDSNKKILEYLSMIGFYRLPLDYLDTWIARVEAVDVAAVKRAFAARIDPDRMVAIVVGAGSGSAQP
jgi:zinc protease